MSQAKELLFLVHRIPFPPNKGDKIRSFNILKHLAKTYCVHVGAFVDDPIDWKYKSDVEALCQKSDVDGQTSDVAEVHLQGLNPGVRKVMSLKGLLTGESLTIPFYASQSMQSWVDELLAKRPIEKVIVFSSPMAQFVSGAGYSHLRRVADFVDIDSDKWAQYAKSKSWPMSWIYGREAKTLLDYERKIASEFDATVFVTDDESVMFKQMAPETASRVSAIHNGVDTEYYSPDRDYPDPYLQQSPRLVFTGAMDYWANVDAVSWFAKEIFPGIRAVKTDAEFYIVGGRPAADVLALAELPGVSVTGSVPDIRPYVAHAQMVVAPMRIARGVQNKVLEGMAMAKSVLVTPEAAEGISARAGIEFLVESEPALLQKQALAMLENNNDEMGLAARKCVVEQYGWEKNLQNFNELLESSGLTSEAIDNPEDVKLDTP